MGKTLKQVLSNISGYEYNFSDVFSNVKTFMNSALYFAYYKFGNDPDYEAEYNYIENSFGPAEKKFFTKDYYLKSFNALIDWSINNERIYKFTYTSKKNEEARADAWEHIYNILTKKYLNRNMPDDFPEDMQKYGYNDSQKKYIKKVFVYIKGSDGNFYNKKEIDEVGNNTSSYCIKETERDTEFSVYYSLSDNVYVNNFNEYEGSYSKFYELCDVFYKTFRDETISYLKEYFENLYYKGILERYRTKNIEDNELDIYQLGELFRVLPKTYEKLNGMAKSINAAETMSGFANVKKQGKTESVGVPFKGLKKMKEGIAFYIKKDDLPKWMLIGFDILNKHTAPKVPSDKSGETDYYPYAYYQYNNDGTVSLVNYKGKILGEPGIINIKTYTDYYKNLEYFYNNHVDLMQQDFIRGNIGFAKPIVSYEIKNNNSTKNVFIENNKLSRLNKEAKVLDYGIDSNGYYLTLDIQSDDMPDLSSNISGRLLIGRLTQTLMDNVVSDINSSNLVTFYSSEGVDGLKNPNDRYDTIEYNSLFDDRDFSVFHQVKNEEKIVFSKNDLTIKLNHFFDRIYAQRDSINEISVSDSNGKKYAFTIKDFNIENKSIIINENLRINELDDEEKLTILSYSQGNKNITLNVCDDDSILFSSSSFLRT